MALALCAVFLASSSAFASPVDYEVQQQRVLSLPHETAQSAIPQSKSKPSPRSLQGRFLHITGTRARISLRTLIAEMLTLVQTYIPIPTTGQMLPWTRTLQHVTEALETRGC